MSPDFVEFEGRVRAETHQAICFEPDGFGEAIWLPRSQLGDGTTVAHAGESGTVEIPRWLALAKGLPV